MSRSGQAIPIIGLAGGIASGKSRVAAELAALGCEVIDYDALVAEALQQRDVRELLRSWWGEQVIDDSGTLDRKAVAKIVFADERQRKRLEEVLHPMVIDQGREMIEAIRTVGKASGIVLDAPLLFEAGLNKDCDAVIFVDASRGIRLARATQKRGWSEEAFEAREKAQMPVDEKRRRSDHVVVNNEDKAGLRRQVGEVFAMIHP